MKQAYILSFTKGITVGAAVDRIVIEIPSTCRELVIERISPGIRQAISVLSSTGATEDELAGLVREADGTDALARLYYYLLIFGERRMIDYGISCNGRRIATLAPASAFFRFSPASITPQSDYTLSRFAYLHRESQDMVLESPLAHGKIVLHGWEAAAVVTELAEAQTPASLCERLPHLPSDAVALFLEMLHAAGFVCETRPGDAYPGENEALIQWDFHDLLFHARSRLGRHDGPYGATYRFHTRIEPQPVIKRCVARESIALYRPDMEMLAQEDVPFTLVLEERKSIRKYAKQPITERRIGEFLYRTARVKEMLSREYQDLSRRPYPGGGAIYELELYLSVRACEGIPSGLYHYCPERHLLEKICDLTQDVNWLLKEAGSAAGLDETPQVLITIAARFQRISWKYESMAYSAILKNVGVLYQTMYLVATAMDLAPCALGGGNSDIFARAAGLDYYAETSVGEFLIGSKRV